MLLAILIIVASVTLFLLLFIYLFRVYKSLKVRHQKPIISPDAIPPELEQHHELAFVLAHGVEAYNEQRRERQQQQRQQRQQTRPQSGTTGEHDDDTASAQSSQPSITPLPPYSPTPTNGDIGYGWIATNPGLFDTPVLISDPSAISGPMHPLENSLPPMYIYPAPNTRSSAQTALLTTDNSPSVTVTAPSASRSNPYCPQSNRRETRRRSVASGILTRRGRSQSNQRSMSLTSVVSAPLSAASLTIETPDTMTATALSLVPTSSSPIPSPSVQHSPRNSENIALSLSYRAQAALIAETSLSSAVNDPSTTLSLETPSIDT
ncbi:hypothetical protein BX616_001645 [Lobosporangium transversale]|uniref:Uncharacterized protein n=1 Tax=Lobosporangium transversale TaxID=64571 RepID=A0A1Y2GGU7_9FUNG|nr:hypothetical protein BCR41DRAFT_359007 [Lobosporangium transversale]KAF9917214.1 hypothetical protein BX616_001645 [Lobosporangium transversale]ORZ08778.1 hypothetical protein BCR41DRAFT_359007 [Lobosporangium transversale]|eukprot:XP_021878561.1 hypothetical protein BCR41DRAFT_359007 [Lobosporangium transversale]